MSICLHCHQPILKRGYRYCSNQCQGDFQYHSYIIAWKQGQLDGSRGIRTKNFSGHVRRYIYEKYGESCSLCGWSQKNAVTGRVPLEIDHIDGVSDNNQESNLRLICPNCHALTVSFRNLNKGAGRNWRRLKYVKETK